MDFGSDVAGVEIVLPGGEGTSQRQDPLGVRSRLTTSSLSPADPDPSHPFRHGRRSLDLTGTQPRTVPGQRECDS